jgi:hypothetical protein
VIGVTAGMSRAGSRDAFEEGPRSDPLDIDRISELTVTLPRRAGGRVQRERAPRRHRVQRPCVRQPRPDRRAHDRRGRSAPPPGHAPAPLSTSPSTSRRRRPAVPRSICARTRAHPKQQATPRRAARESRRLLAGHQRDLHRRRRLTFIPSAASSVNSSGQPPTAFRMSARQATVLPANVRYPRSA